MAVLKKILLLVFSAMIINIPFSPVYADQSAGYVGNIVYTEQADTVTASVDVTADNQKRILVLAAYKDGLLQRITADSKLVNGTETLKTEISVSGVDKISASVVDAFDGNVLTSKAVYGTDSTSLEYIKINGEEVDYSDDTDEYYVKYSQEPVVIDVSVKDGTTKATVSDYTLPGKAGISVVSSSGEQRNIVVYLYKSDEDLYKLNGIKYKVGDKICEVEDFSPNKKQYSIELEDNVMGVTLIPEAVGNVSCMISNAAVESINGVSLGSWYSTGKSAFQYKHNARNNYIPIKNEKTTAYITVTSGSKSMEYQFEFSSKQPRLTSFEYVGAKDDSHKPVFVGGSALNNDNGTILSMDRRWGIGNISKALLGGSCFMLPAENRNAGYWWKENTSGEYFNFTADTKGTVYVLSGKPVINTAEYDGWTIGSDTVELSDDEWIMVAKDWNGYSAKYFASSIEYQDDSSRAVNPGIAENSGSDSIKNNIKYPCQMGGYAYRTFEAGEKVSIYHTGQNNQNGAKTMVIIVWGDHSEPEEVPTPTPTPEPSEEIEDEDKIMSLVFDNKTDTTKNVWSDNSGYHNDVTLNVDENNCWTANGLKVTSGSAQSILLPDAVCSAVDSNVFTIQFEIPEINTVSGKKCGIMSSQNGDFEIYADNSKVYFTWAGNTTALTKPNVTLEQMTGHLNTIVVDKNETNINQRIKWYIDGELKTSKKMNNTDKTVDNIRLSNPSSTYEGNVVFKSLTVYKKILTSEEISGGGAE